MIGYRALRMCGDAERLGLYGFGASAHLVCQVAAHQGRRVFAITRAVDADKREFARGLGAEWAGAADEVPEPLDAAIIFAPAGALVPAALRALAPGGVVVCAGIHMSDIPSFPYADLWGERQIRSVANLTRRDGEEFLAARGRGRRERRDHRFRAWVRQITHWPSCAGVGFGARRCCDPERGGADGGRDREAHGGLRAHLRRARC